MLVKILGRIIKPKNKKIPGTVRNILIIRSGALGDVLMTTPLIAAIRKKYKNAKISYLVGEWSSIALKNNPNINEIIEFDDRIIFQRNMGEIIKLIRKIRALIFDICFILDKSYHWNLFAYLAKIPFRIGFERNGEGLANNLDVKFDASKHEIEYYMDIARLIGVKNASNEMKIFTTAKDRKKVNKFFRKNKLINKIVIGIAAGGAENPGQAMYEKRWTVEKYIGLTNILTENHKIIVLLFGGRNDASVNKLIKEQCLHKNQVLDISNYNLHEAFEMMKKCSLFVTHDSGAMHIAGASKAKLIALFGPTQAERFAPKNAIIIKSPAEGCPCYDMYGDYNRKVAEKCMRAISVDTVYQEIKKIIKNI